ncbi:MAG: mannose-6-phosphate isomerase [Chitinivibrionales bacterium]|nr:mannose-6-phosphate isomerase [Chitinivibrionales bacterium]MBD3357042.1 mannose-6-phosphate isomerase [Chitinivibrionales bacterium]
MNMSQIDTPLLFEPIYKEKIWGGRNLSTSLSKELPPEILVGESWELTGFDTDWSVVQGGKHAGTTLQRLVEMFGPELLGRIPFRDALPLLYKFIDANDKLSVQVHPDDYQARANSWGNFGKTECWYIVEAKPEARIIVGFKEGVKLSDVEKGIKDDSLGELLNTIPVSRGDMLFVPAGTVHAIMDGTLIYEVQESSDTTFRLYDWGRTDKAGVSRRLHITESLEVLDTEYHDRHKILPLTVDTPRGNRRSFRVACKYFVVEEYRLDVGGCEELPPKQSFQVITVLDRPVELVWTGGTMKVGTGRTVFIPAALREISIKADGGASFLASSVPDLRSEVIEPLRSRGVSDDSIASLGGNPTKNHLLPLL